MFCARPRVQPAEEAIEDLCAKMAGLLERMAAGLRDGSVPDAAAAWLAQARSLGEEIRRVDEALRQAEESIRLNPAAAAASADGIDLRAGLETLEHAAITVRGLARLLADRSPAERGQLARCGMSRLACGSPPC